MEDNYEGSFSGLQKDRGKLTSRRAFDSFQKEQYKEPPCKGHRKIRKGASTGVEEEGRNFRIVEGDERKKGQR